MFGEYAENVVASLTKGTRVIVQGRLTQRSYTDNQGQQRTSLDLAVEEVGPSLRFASAQVTRGQSRGQGGFGGGQGGFGGGQGAPMGQSSWGQPAAPMGGQQAPVANDNPWTNSGQGGDFGGFDDEQPF